jgi:hypothetical protein
MLTCSYSYYYAQNGYQPYAASAQQIMMRTPQAAPAAQTSRASSSAGGGGGGSGGGGDDVTTMNDVLGTAGIDLRVRFVHRVQPLTDLSFYPFRRRRKVFIEGTVRFGKHTTNTAIDPEHKPKSIPNNSGSSFERLHNITKLRGCLMNPSSTSH